ncbi:MAG: aspartate dehydrogenase [Eubacterium sp.]|nr:aspartate dehydrogenase [Eubacterium sp.]
MSIFRKKKTSLLPEVKYDPETTEAILKCNTCNRDRVLVFKDINTGELTEVANILSDHELEDYKKTYGINTIHEVYGW